MKGMVISNNYIIAHEILHSFKKKEKCKFMGMKLDMAKAYDHLEWDFFMNVLGAFRFHIS